MERKSIGAASLAQVHKAKLNDGTTVAVKVQHRRVKSNSFVDCTTMEALVRTVALLFPEFKLMWLVEETKKNLPLELDFVNEGQNADRVRRMFVHLPFLKVPEIKWEYSTDRVLTMEFCEGGQVNDLDYIDRHSISPSEVCRKLGQLYSEMIFVQGCVHCDPHPGNVLVNKSHSKGLQIVLLDHGLYTILDEDFRLNYSKLWLSLMNADLIGIREAGKHLNVGEDLYALLACMVCSRSWNSIVSGIDKQSLTTSENEEIKSYVGSYLVEISEVLNRVPRPMLLIFKTNDLLRSIEYSLKVQRNAYSFLQMSKCCVTAVHDYSYNRCDSLYGKITQIFSTYVSMTKLLCYEWFLNLSNY
uniref:ABC1 atypical kinase-like domain-containing protein n=1 Tax=Romanomermis culicivorax TaxID=13658 RepID=A0A915L536_ROMCU